MPGRGGLEDGWIVDLRRKLVGAIDQVALWRMGMINPDERQDLGDLTPVDAQEFWAKSRISTPAELRIEAEWKPKSSRWKHVRVVELMGPSFGPGKHFGSRHLRARAYIQRTNDVRPLILLLHGFAAPTPYWEDFHARILLDRGFHVARMDLPFHFRRRIPHRPSGEGFFSTDMDYLRGVIRQSVEDAASVINWSRSEITPLAGAVGFSLGGLVSALLAANIPLESMVGIVPAVDLPQTLWVRSPSRVKKRMGLQNGRGGRWAATIEGALDVVNGSLAPIIPINLEPATDPKRIVLVAAEGDLVVGGDPVMKLAEAWGTDCWSYLHGHVTVMTEKGIIDRMYERVARDAFEPSITTTVTGRSEYSHTSSKVG